MSHTCTRFPLDVQENKDSERSRSVTAIPRAQTVTLMFRWTAVFASLVGFHVRDSEITPCFLFRKKKIDWDFMKWFPLQCTVLLKMSGSREIGRRHIKIFMLWDFHISSCLHLWMLSTFSLMRYFSHWNCHLKYAQVDDWMGPKPITWLPNSRMIRDQQQRLR